MGEPTSATIADRYGVPVDAVETLQAALRRGGGRQAQFSHPALGGMGQWSSGGGIMIGDMFDHDLKAKVARLCDELAASDSTEGAADESGGFSSSAGARPWWPNGLGRPSATGGQNEHGYACFPESRRLAIRDGERVSLYDTGEHRITGVSQQQSGTRDLVFTSQHGPVRLSDLISIDHVPTAEPASSRPDAIDLPVPRMPSSSDVIELIERLHELQRKGILTQEEFAAKKA